MSGGTIRTITSNSMSVAIDTRPVCASLTMDARPCVAGSFRRGCHLHASRTPLNLSLPGCSRALIVRSDAARCFRDALKRRPLQYDSDPSPADAGFCQAVTKHCIDLIFDRTHAKAIVPNVLQKMADHRRLDASDLDPVLPGDRSDRQGDNLRPDLDRQGAE